MAALAADVGRNFERVEIDARDEDSGYTACLAALAKLKVRLPAGKPIEGTVIFKAVESDYATQRDVSRRKRDIKTIGLKLKVDNPDGALVPGMTAEVLLPADLAKGK